MKRPSVETMMPLRTQTRTLVLLLVLALVGCGGDKAQLQTTESRSDDPNYRGGPDGLPFFLESVDPVPLQVEATWSVPLKIRLQTENFVATGQESINFEIIEVPDGEASLSARTAVTNDMGIATIDLRLGLTPGTAIVRATHRKASPLDIHINIGAPTTGTFRVDVRDPANAPLELPPYRVQVFSGNDFDCAAYRPRHAVPNPLSEGGTNVRGEPVFQSGFGPNEEFTIIAEALGERGITLAAGCVQNKSVLPGITELVEINLSMVPITPSGTFDVESTWDMSEAIAGSSGTASAMIRVIEFMANPGEAIYDIVLDEVEDAVGFGIDILLDIAGIKDRAINYINDQINRSATAATFTAISADLSTMLNELRVTSKLTISKTDQEYKFSGHEEWQSIDISWTWRCEDQQSPDCATQTVDLTEEGAAAGTVQYDWTGSVAGYDSLNIESHAAQIDIGRLQLYLLEQVILPDITNGNAHSIEEAISHWVNCDQLANQALQGREVCDPTGVFCAGPPEAAQGCEAALGLLAGYVTDQIDQIDTSVDIELTGRATLIDGDGDTIADQIDDGITTGQLAGSTEPVTVEWTAVKTIATP